MALALALGLDYLKKLISLHKGLYKGSPELVVVLKSTVGVGLVNRSPGPSIRYNVIIIKECMNLDNVKNKLRASKIITG